MTPEIYTLTHCHLHIKSKDRFPDMVSEIIIALYLFGKKVSKETLYRII